MEASPQEGFFFNYNFQSSIHYHDHEKPTIISSIDYLDEAVKALRRGLIVAYPTETFYGLAVDPFNEDALRSLFHLKGRAFTEPVSVIIGDQSMLASIVAEVTPLAKSVDGRVLAGAAYSGL